MNNNNGEPSISKPWMEIFSKEIFDVTEISIKTWCDILVDLGVEENVREDWCKTFKDQVQVAYNDLIEDVREQQKRFIKKIEAALQKSSQLCKELQIKIPEFGAKKLNLQEEYIALAEKILELEEQVDIRKANMDSVNKQQRRLCNLLGKEPKNISEHPLPTEEQLNAVRYFIETLENERFQRSERFLETQGYILEIAESLEYEANLDFEKIVLSQKDSEFLLTDDNMELLEQFLIRLQRLQYSTTEEMADIKEKLSKLWQILNEDIKGSADFLEAHSAITLSNLKALKEELDRLNQLRKDNVEMFLKSLKDDLVKVWDQCHYTPEQRADFIYFQTELYTDDLLTLHDLEIQRLKCFYSNNQELYHLLDKWHGMKAELTQLEEKVNAPDRFKNRGGQLLKDEKNRNALTKLIPTTESKLITLAEKFEEKEGYQFTSWGNTIQKLIDEDHKVREEERILKQSARKKDRTLTPGTSTLGLNRILTPGNTTGKRKVFQTSDRAAKKLKVLTESNNVPKINLSKPFNNCKPMSRSSIERIRIQNKYKRLSFISRQNKGKNKENSATGSEYFEFENYMENKNECRSTIFNRSDSIGGIVELPKTPVLLKVPSSHTPRTAGKTQDRLPTPRLASKVALSSLDLNF